MNNNGNDDVNNNVDNDNDNDDDIGDDDVDDNPPCDLAYTLQSENPGTACGSSAIVGLHRPCYAVRR